MKIAIVELPDDLYNYMCIVSPERAFKLPPNHHEFIEFKERVAELFTNFRETAWEEI